MAESNLAPQAKPSNAASDELVTLRKYQDLLDASLAKTTLESAEIESFIKDEYTIGHVVEVSLQVRQADAETARQILDPPIPESFEVEGVGNFEQPRCPDCGSLDVSSFGSEGGKELMSRSEQLGWKCNACQHVWADSNV